MDGVTIRGSFEGLLFKLQASEGVEATMSAATDAIPFTAGSYSDGEDTRLIETTEASGSLSAGAPVIAGQSVPITFTFPVKGAGVGAVYSSSVKPPHHAVYSAAGLRGLFQAAIASAVATAGSAIAATLGAGFATDAQAYRGMPFSVTAGPNSGELLLCSDYSAAKVATFVDLLGTAFTTSSSIALLANWTYAPTSPADEAARATDQPAATLYRYVDGKLRRFKDVRGQISVAGTSSGIGIATFTGTGTFLGESDAAFPDMVLASHSAPLILQGSHPSEAFLINRRPLAISQFDLATAATIESPDDPNTEAGFAGAIIGRRVPLMTADPLATLVATRNTLADIKTGARYPAGVRGGYVAGNRWGLTVPLAQPVGRGETDRGQLKAEALQLRAINPGKDAAARDGDFVLSFY